MGFIGGRTVALSPECRQAHVIGSRSGGNFTHLAGTRGFSRWTIERYPWAMFNSRRTFIALSLCGGFAMVALKALAGSEPQPGISLGGTATGTTLEAIPPVVTLEGAAESESTSVRLRRFSATAPLRELGTIRHAPHSGRRGVLWSHANRTAIVVTAAIRPPARTTYDTALFALENGQTRTLIGDGISNSSAPLITDTGLILVQTGTSGTDPEPIEGQRVLRLRSDQLAIEAITLERTQRRTVYRTQGQIAFLACALRNNHFLLYHVTDEGAFLRDVDASATDSARTIAGPFAALARDFSFDPQRNEVTFAQAQRVGSEQYEIVTMNVATGARRTRLTGATEHFMPTVLHDGTIAFSPPADPGLALLALDRTSAQALSPLGQGSDWVIAENANQHWLAVRHLDAQTHNDTFVVVTRDGSRRAVFSDPTQPIEVVDFWRTSL